MFGEEVGRVVWECLIISFFKDIMVILVRVIVIIRRVLNFLGVRLLVGSIMRSMVWV